MRSAKPSRGARSTPSRSERRPATRDEALPAARDREHRRRHRIERRATRTRSSAKRREVGLTCPPRACRLPPSPRARAAADASPARGHVERREAHRSAPARAVAKAARAAPPRAGPCDCCSRWSRCPVPRRCRRRAARQTARCRGRASRSTRDSGRQRAMLGDRRDVRVVDAHAVDQQGMRRRARRASRSSCDRRSGARRDGDAAATQAIGERAGAADRRSALSSSLSAMWIAIGKVLLARERRRGAKEVVGHRVRRVRRDADADERRLEIAQARDLLAQPGNGRARTAPDRDRRPPDTSCRGRRASRMASNDDAGVAGVGDRS